MKPSGQQTMMRGVRGQTTTTMLMRKMFSSLKNVKIPKLDYKYLKSNLKAVSENIENRKSRGNVTRVAESHGTFFQFWKTP
jgi:hypothetical protein